MDTSDVSSSVGSTTSIPLVPKKRRLEEYISTSDDLPDTTEAAVTESTTGAASTSSNGNGVSENGSSSEKVDKLVASVEAFTTFENFTVKRILINSADQKRVIVEATVGQGETAVVVLDKKPFTEQIVQDLFSQDSALNRTFQNDIYGSYSCNPIVAASEVKTTIVYPATDKHIEKYLIKPLHLVIETPEIYEKVTQPFLESSAFTIDWVYNILEHKQEADRIVYEDPDPVNGFVLLPDLKWDGKTLENLYLVAIVHPKGIKSLRDLNQDHLPLLENIRDAGIKAIEEKYGLKRSCLRIYFHYQPSYYHLHVHFTALQFNAPGNFAEKSHILQSVISNIKANPKHYREASLPFVVKQGDKLYNALEKYGYEF